MEAYGRRQTSRDAVQGYGTLAKGEGSVHVCWNVIAGPDLYGC